MQHLLYGFLACLPVISACSSSNDDPPCQLAKQIVDSWPGPSDGAPGQLTVLDDTLYYQVNDGVHGEELWKYNTSTGPSIVADLVPGSGGSNPEELTAFNDKLYFTATSINMIPGLWFYDPAEPGTGITRVLDAFDWADGLTELDGKLYFRASDGVYGAEIWVYDSVSGARILADLQPGIESSGAGGYTVFDGKLFFIARSEEGTNLWMLNPEIGIPEIIRLNTAVVDEGSRPGWLTLFDNKLYFKADDGVHGSELWAYDAVNGATIVADINAGEQGSNISYFHVLENKLYMSADDGVTGEELWVYDPAVGTMLVADVNPGAGTGYHSHDSAVLDGKLVFEAYDDIYGAELRIYDPQDGSIALMADIVPGVGGTGDDDPETPTDLRVVDNQLYFLAWDGFAGYGRTLWTYDHMDGARKINEVWPGTGIERAPRSVTPFNGKLFFSASSSAHGEELWAYDPACR